MSATTTVGSRADADRLAREILARRLAACVQVEEGLTSHYRWEGRACEEAEVRLTFKTLPACGQALQQAVQQLHPYELPQWLSCTLQAGAAYAAWVRGEVAVPA